MRDEKEDVVCGASKDRAGVGCLEWRRRRLELLFVCVGADDVSLILIDVMDVLMGIGPAHSGKAF